MAAARSESMPADLEVLTIGHSTQSYLDFRKRLYDANVTAVADVRTTPFSRYFPHFNKKNLQSELTRDSIAYVFLGDELGGRPQKDIYYTDGVADYEKMSADESFKKGIARVIEGAQKYRIALLCSEHDPLDCHRCLLVGRALKENRVNVLHILGDGNKIEHSEIEKRLLDLAGDNSGDLFESTECRLARAYRNRSMKVAYSEQIDDEPHKLAGGRANR